MYLASRLQEIIVDRHEPPCKRIALQDIQTSSDSACLVCVWGAMDANFPCGLGSESAAEACILSSQRVSLTMQKGGLCIMRVFFQAVTFDPHLFRAVESTNSEAFVT